MVKEKWRVNTCKTQLDVERERRAMVGKNDFKFWSFHKTEDCTDFILYRYNPYAYQTAQLNNDGFLGTWFILSCAQNSNVKDADDVCRIVQAQNHPWVIDQATKDLIKQAWETRYAEQA